jgi:hypothetical protein
MAEEVQQPGSDSLGWRAGLPDDLKQDEAFVPFKTVGDFAKAHKETAAKAKDYEGKLANSIPKLAENATAEERDRFYNSLGRPEKPDGYEFVGEDKAAPEWTKAYKDAMHKMGVPKAMAKELSQFNNTMINQMVEQHNAKILKENTEAVAVLKSELGDKYEPATVLVSRLWKQWGKTEVEFDKAFATESSANRVTMMRFLLNVAAKTGEDTSLRGAGPRQDAPKPGYDLSGFNLPAARV